MSSELLLPQGLDFRQGVVLEKDLAYFSTSYPNVSENLGKIDIDLSLHQFAECVSGEQITNFMTDYKKSGYSSNQSTFFLKQVRGMGYKTIEESGFGQFYMDAGHSLVLGTGNEQGKKLWLAVVGIALGNELDLYDEFRHERGRSPLGKGRMNFQYQFPVITQLQRPGYAGYDSSKSNETEVKEKNENAAEIMSSFRWEKALIDLVLLWAQNQNIPAVYMLPGNLNKWYRDEKEMQYKMRYDLTAQRSGFRMQPNGLYGISLLPFPSLRS